MVAQIISDFFRHKKKQTKEENEWEKFRREAKEQFIRLKEKGITIPVATL